MTLLADLGEFVREHRPHGELHPHATEPEARGYRLTIPCPCGVTFERWVAPVDAALDLARLARFN
jgi:hypothetical protein